MKYEMNADIHLLLAFRAPAAGTRCFMGLPYFLHWSATSNRYRLIYAVTLPKLSFRLGTTISTERSNRKSPPSVLDSSAPVSRLRLPILPSSVAIRK